MKGQRFSGKVGIIYENIASIIIVLLNMQLSAVYLHLNCHLGINVENE